MVTVMPKPRVGADGAVLLAILVLQWCSPVSRAATGYAIQPSSDIIYEEPQSRTVLAGSSASFICNTSSIAPATGYSLPNIAWRVNGNTTLPGSNWKIIPHTNMASSELLVRSAEPTDASYIECLVEDGELNSNYLLVTSSRRASLTVVALVQNSTFENVSMGQYLRLNCIPGTPQLPQHVQWYKDGNVLQNLTILSNGDLLLPGVSMADSGSYMCQAWFGQDIINGTILTILINNGDHFRPPRLLLDSDALAVEGRPFSLSCYLVEGQNTADCDFQWLKDGKFINIGMSNDSITGHNRLWFASLNQSHAGGYQCQARCSTTGTTHSDISSNVMNITVLTFPMIVGRNITEDQTAKEQISIESGILAPPDTKIYCYKNGIDIKSQGLSFDDITGEISVPNDGDIRDVVGVYQCFANNAAGSVHSTTRLLNNGFINPPTNLKCNVEPGFSELPHVTLTWDPPTLNTWPDAPLRYIIHYRDSNGDEDARSDKEEYTFQSSKSIFQYQFNVAVIGAQQSADITCMVFTEHRVTMQEHALDVTCSQDNVAVRWKNPGVVFLNGLDNFDLTGVCIHGNKMLSYKYHCDQSLLYDAPDVSSNVKVITNSDLPFIFCTDLLAAPELKFNATDNGTALPDGAVCLFGGDYEYDLFLDDPDNPRITTIPTASCATPPRRAVTNDLAPVELGLVCSHINITVSWVTSVSEGSQFENITIEGRCQDLTGWEEEFSYINTTSPSGIVRLVNSSIPEGAMCSFYGSFYINSGSQGSLTPVQCIVGEENDFYPLLCDIEPSSMPTLSPSPTLQGVSSSSSMPALSSSPNPQGAPSSSSSVPTLSPSPNPQRVNSTAFISSREVQAWWAVIVIIPLLLLIIILVVLCFGRKKLSTRKSEELQKLAESVAAYYRQQEIADPDSYCSQNKDLISVWPASTREDDATSEITLIMPYVSQSGRISRKNSMSSLVNIIEQEGHHHFMMTRFLEDQWSHECREAILMKPASLDEEGEFFKWQEICKVEDHAETSHDSVLKPDLADHIDTISEADKDTDHEAQKVVTTLLDSASIMACSSGYATDSYCTSRSSSAQSPLEYFLSKTKELELDEETAQERECALKEAGSVEIIDDSSDERIIMHQLDETCDIKSVPNMSEMVCVRAEGAVLFPEMHMTTSAPQTATAESHSTFPSYQLPSPCLSTCYEECEGYIHMKSVSTPMESTV